MNRNKLNFLLVEKDISDRVVTEKLGITKQNIESYVQQYGIRQCDTCKKRYFEPNSIKDTTCPRCFDLMLADFNIEFMADVGAINNEEAIKIRGQIDKIILGK